MNFKKELQKILESLDYDQSTSDAAIEIIQNLKDKGIGFCLVDIVKTVVLKSTSPWDKITPYTEEISVPEGCFKEKIYDYQDSEPYYKYYFMSNNKKNRVQNSMEIEFLNWIHNNFYVPIGTDLMWRGAVPVPAFSNGEFVKIKSLNP